MVLERGEDQGEKAPARRYWQLELMLGLLMFLVGFNVLLTVSLLRPALQGWADFRQLYTGGYMVRVGARANFYDYDTQLKYEQKLVPIPSHLPVNHLAYEHLLFAPLSLVGYKPAYLIFSALNIVLAVLTVKWLLPSGSNLTRRWRLFVPCLVAAFLPIWRALLQGQDSILLLALLAGAMFVLEDGREFAAGMLVGAGLFKFQIVLPIALLYLLWKKWRFVWGFCLLAAVVLAVSVWMVGRLGVHQYVAMMAGMSVHLKSQADVMHYGTSPVVMLNLRGLVTGLFGSVLPHEWIQGLIALSSICILALAASFPRGREAWGTADPVPLTKAGQSWGATTPYIFRAEGEPSRHFSFAVLAASLVSYHFIEHDASVLIIPVVVALSSLSTWRAAAAVAVFVGMLAGLAPQYGFLAALPVLILFATEIGTPLSKSMSSGATA